MAYNQNGQWAGYSTQQPVGFTPTAAPTYSTQVVGNYVTDASTAANSVSLGTYGYDEYNYAASAAAYAARTQTSTGQVPYDSSKSTAIPVNYQYQAPTGSSVCDYSTAWQQQGQYDARYTPNVYAAAVPSQYGTQYGAGGTQPSTQNGQQYQLQASANATQQRQYQEKPNTQQNAARSQTADQKTVSTSYSGYPTTSVAYGSNASNVGTSAGYGTSNIPSYNTSPATTIVSNVNNSTQSITYNQAFVKAAAGVNMRSGVVGSGGSRVTTQQSGQQGSRENWWRNRTGFGNQRNNAYQQPMLFCEICKVSCAGRNAYNDHIAGQRHTKKAKAKALENEAAAKTATAQVESKPKAEEKGDKPVLTTPAVAAPLSPPKPKIVNSVPVFLCKLCDVECTAVSAYAAHVRGVKHNKVLKLYEKLGKPIPPDNMKALAAANPGAKKPDDAEVPDEDDIYYADDRPVVGQEYIEEERDANGKLISFKCSLCACTFSDPNSKDMHTKGRRHRLQYKKKVDPSLEVELGPKFGHKGARNKFSSPASEKWRKGEHRRNEITNERHSFGLSSNAENPIAPVPPTPDANDERHLAAYHNQIYPSSEDLDNVLIAVTTVESALEKVKIAESKPAIATTKSESDGQENMADGKKVVLENLLRVGILGKGLILKGDTTFQLVMLCNEKPTMELLDRVAASLSTIIQANTSKFDYKVHKQIAEALLAIQVSHKLPKTSATESGANTKETKADQTLFFIHVIFTSAIIREEILAAEQAKKGLNANGETEEPAVVATPDPPNMLSKKRCLSALAELRHTKWFTVKAENTPQCVKLIRIFRSFTKKGAPWSFLHPWLLELVVEKLLTIADGPLALSDGFRYILEALSTSILFEQDGLIIADPCEKEQVDVRGLVATQNRELITHEARKMLRMVAFQQIHKALGMDELPPLPAKKPRPFQNFGPLNSYESYMNRKRRREVPNPRIIKKKKNFA